MKPCFFRELGYGPCEYRADGKPDPVHLIPAQRIRRSGQPQHALDPRVIVAGCRKCHDRFDGRDALNKITLSYEDHPRSVYEFASQFGWWWAGPRDGWRREAPREAA